MHVKETLQTLFYIFLVILCINIHDHDFKKEKKALKAVYDGIYREIYIQNFLL